MLSERQKLQIQILDDIYDISTKNSTRTYIWGGLVIDILEGSFLREHKDIDCFTLNLLDVKDSMDIMFRERGYATEFISGIDMFNVHKDGCSIGFNRLEYDSEIAMWHHIGNEGTLFFPRVWLENEPRIFYNTRVFISGIEFEYCIKARVDLLDPTWQLREKDTEALKYLTGLLGKKNVSSESVLRMVRSDNPYWGKKRGKE